MKEIKVPEYDSWKCLSTDNMVCPYCGHENEPIDINVEAIDDITWECEECEKTFSAAPEYSVSFTTRPIEEHFLEKKGDISRRIERYKDGHEYWQQQLYAEAVMDLKNLEKEAQKLLEGEK